MSPRRYRSPEEDSARWDGFEFRDGDIVISTRSKSGTTWMQMICALLVFRTPELPAPLPELSPWLDWLVVPEDEIYSRLAAQRHRRFVKTHTPLDGLPMDSRAAYVVVARNPLDMAVSLYHQGDNLDRERMRQLTAPGDPDGGEPVGPVPVADAVPAAETVPAARLRHVQQRDDLVPASGQDPGALHDWLVGWIERDADPVEELDSLPGVIRHLGDAWARRDDPVVVLAHYEDLSADLDGEMRRLAARLGFDVPAGRWPELVRAATFAAMRENAGRLAPDPAGVLKDRQAFFRGGRSGAGAELLTPAEFQRYRTRVRGLADADALRWIHHGTRSPGPTW